MLPKASIEHIVAKQRKALYDMPAGHPREISGSLPYLSDRPLLIGGMRGSGRAMLLGRMLKDEYPEAWYTDFDDPRLAGFDESDFAKLDRLIRDSGKGILLLNKVDCAAGWLPFLSEKPAQGIKVIATVSLPYYIDRNSEALKVLVHIRDEAHRFGITFHRKKRSLAFIRSELESIPTLGPRSVDKLLRHYRTVSNIRRASEEELSGLIGRQRAAEVIRYYSKAGELSVAHGTDGPSPSHDESDPSDGRAIPLTTAGKDDIPGGSALFDAEGDGFAPKQRG